ncbi:MAG: glycosyltransferase family 39 protein [Devosia sp.]
MSLMVYTKGAWHKRAAAPRGMGLNTTPIALTGPTLRIVQIVCVFLICLKLAQLSFAGVFMDEAYYWMWGQHPALSYYDHPPLNAWMLGLSSSVFGWNLFALRLPIGLAFFTDILALFLISRRIGGAPWQSHFWITLLLFLVTPIYWMITNYGLPDHTLLTCCLFAIHFFYCFFQDRSENRPGATRDLTLGALFLGLAVLSKYNGAFLGIGIALFVLFRDRALLRQPRMYLAAALALAIQIPVVVWNASERFASFGFIVGGRHSGLNASFDGLYPLAIGILIFISPILFWPIAKFVFSRAQVAGFGFARVTFLVSTVAIVAISFTTATLFHWNLVAYAAMLPFLALYIRPRWLLALQSVCGAALAAALFVNYSIVQITPAQWRDEATAWSYGWAPTAEAVRLARAEHEVGFVAGADYTTASLLGFELHDKEVASLSPRQEQYDFWFDQAAHAGQDAILFGDDFRPLSAGIAAQFESVTEIIALDVIQGDRRIDTHHLYLAKGFKPNG